MLDLVVAVITEGGNADLGLGWGFLLKLQPHGLRGQAAGLSKLQGSSPVGWPSIARVKLPLTIEK
jgi:hypothetical protein